jgi:glutathione S-transferase
VEAVLYSMSISHPARAAGLMLRYKGIEARRVDMPAGSQQLIMRARGFRRGTVPGLKLDGRRVQGSREISRTLDEIQPDPPLFPADPGERAAVEEAERWGESVYQPVPRRIFRWAVAHDSRLRLLLAKGTGLPTPAVTSKLMFPVAHVYVRFEGGGEAAARRDVEQVPIHLDHVDELIASGTLGGEDLNAADFQIATTTRALMNLPQIRAMVEDRAAGEHAMRIVPEFGRGLPVELPAEWLPGHA